jgi:hypothetical protein
MVSARQEARPPDKKKGMAEVAVFLKTAEASGRGRKRGG